MASLSSSSSAPTSAALQRLREELCLLQEPDLTDMMTMTNNSYGEPDMLLLYDKENQRTSDIEHDALLHEYEAARDAYLRGKITSSLLQWVTQYNDICVSSHAAIHAVTQRALERAPTLEEQQQVAERRDQVVARLQASVQRARMLQAQLQAKYTEHQTRKEELLQLIQQAEEKNVVFVSSSRRSSSSSSNNNDSSSSSTRTHRGLETTNMKDNNEEEEEEHETNDDSDEEKEIDEQEFAALQDQLTALQQRKVELQMKVQDTQRQTDQIEKAWRQEAKQIRWPDNHQALPLSLLPKEFSLDNDDDDHDQSDTDQMDDVTIKQAILSLQAENSKLQSKIDQYQEMADFYQNLTTVMEELRGMRIIETKPAKGSTEAAGDSSENSPHLELTVRLLDRYDVHLELQASNTTIDRNGSYRVKAATFDQEIILSSAEETISKEMSDHTAAVAATAASGATIAYPIQLPVPKLDDLVRLSQSMKPVESLRFVLREATARIMCLQARVRELTVLQQEFGGQEGLALSSLLSEDDDNENHIDGTDFGGRFQDVACRLETKGNAENQAATVGVVLRMTPDCPLLAGSVYIEQIGTPPATTCEFEKLQDHERWVKLKEEFNQQRFASPVELMRALRQAVCNHGDDAK